MSFTPTKYPQGTFSWADFFSTDINASKKFFTSLFGWTSEDMPTLPGMPDYTMFSLDGKYVAGGSPSFDPNMPSYWSNYISVDNVDEMAKKAEELGGKIIMQPMDVLDSGRMATIQDPTGAMVSIWQANKHIGAGVINKVGAMCWNELYTPDLEKSKDYYGKLFGWTFETDEKDGYTTIQNNGRANGGIIVITPEMGNVPPNWTVYFTVKDINDSVTKVKELGGTVGMGPMEVGPGHIAMVADPAGAHFMILQMTVKPDEWEE